jgi:PTH1 family peptidyl-tRNA hydrolase
VKLVVGLGNPGPRYVGSRHNVGFRVLDHFAREQAIPLSRRAFAGRYGQGAIGGEPVGLLQPETFMNRSGESVLLAVDGLGVEAPEHDLLVVYDDMDLPLGRIRLRKGGGAGGQNGIGHVIECLATRELPRIRFGVGRPPAGEDPIDYLLSRFESADTAALDAAVARACAAIEIFVREGMDAAMNRYNLPPAATGDAGAS